MGAKARWDIPRTEEGLQQVLALLAQARETADEAAEGRALLELSFLVKWVRSDNDEPPFERSHTLALEALRIFRRIKDPDGQVTALMYAAPFESRESSGKMLAEAEQLAADSGDDFQIARVLTARARQMAFVDPVKAIAMNHEALALFRKLGNASGIAQCLFSLSISDGTSAQKRDYALEAAKSYRDGGNRKEAGKAIMIALMNAEGLGEVAALEPQIREALGDAQSAGDRHTEGRCYSYLAQIAEGAGNAEEAAKYLRWADDLQDSDGLSPRERWEQNVEMSKMMVAMAKRMGNKEMVRSCQEELKRLKADKP